MYEYEIATAARSADLIREAAEYRASLPGQEHRRRVRTFRSRFTRSARAARSAPRTA
ncbi:MULTISPECIES: hypothetical protein [unclassified Streptomyces]|uniref:hypothetical protein n=1 Tax=unclassified Streptomyces TaxID=2593676 RepID=UPI002E13B82D|nr:hypothetical protein OG457_15270 [Streptomyces sp. NBC_01207]WTA18399.1 hypothetical protein OG365_10170 [Streptomyces sp. NBC_00853]